MGRIWAVVGMAEMANDQIVVCEGQYAAHSLHEKAARKIKDVNFNGNKTKVAVQGDGWWEQ